MQLVQIKRLGPGKFYLSHKGDHTFIKGNRSSHKGWMSRFFYVKWAEQKRNPWRSEMSWRDNIYTLTPSTPEHSPNFVSFLDAMREKSYNAPDLIKEDLLCHFGFSREGVELVGNLAEHMGKAEMLRALQESTEASSSGAAAPPLKVAKKRKDSTPAKKEARSQKKKGAYTTEVRRPPTPPGPMREGRLGLMPVIVIHEVHSLKGGPTTEMGSDRAPALNLFEDSLVVSPSRAVATGLLCNMVPDRDVARVRSASEVVALFAAQLAAAMVWGGEVIKRLTQTQREANSTRQSFDEVMEHHTELEMQLEVEKAARAAEKEASAAEKKVMGAELDETKARAEAEIRRLRSEAANAWDLGKEDFLNSSEFDDLCTKKSLDYFRSGFEGCVAQFRANGYFEEEHATPFLSLAVALEYLPEEDDEEANDDDEEDDACATPPSSPKP
ncbi:myosin heavy chain-related protein [Dorcoceras hygrometricum]|uniref:Myosin heavy chain-related protein n=1 Tax=Dorcoceras hygrometricum TaxID=472368 RepID=A0A2Z7A348_9LAMI|nr:myosin heavy chain-related protein [Dorcoceras hygrometricum]